jgi:flagellin
MAAVLSTNMASLYAQKNLSTAQASLSQSVERLSSGTRISSAKDDAAGFGISQSVTSTKNIADQNVRNIQNGISWLQTADGALDVVGKILQRSLTLMTEAQDATLNTDQKKAIGAELVALYKEVANIGLRTKFQGGTAAVSVFDITVPNNSYANNILKVDTGSGTTTDTTAKLVDLTVATPAANGVTSVFKTAADAITLNGVSGSADKTKDVAEIQALIAINATNRAALGAGQNSLQYAADNIQTLSNNLADSVGRIVDTDYAAETANLTRTQILQQAATSMLAQANQMPNVILTLLK